MKLDPKEDGQEKSLVTGSGKPQENPMPPPSIMELRGNARIEGQYFFFRVPHQNVRPFLEAGIPNEVLETMLNEFLLKFHFYAMIQENLQVILEELTRRVNEQS